MADIRPPLLSTAESPSTSFSPSKAVSPSKIVAPPPRPLVRRPNFDFAKAGSNSAFTFAIDLAHRDFLALKADAEARRLHRTPTANGFQAFKLSPAMVRSLHLTPGSLC